MIETTIANLEKHNFVVHRVATADEAKDKVIELIPLGSAVGFGGSTTVAQAGIHDALRAGDYRLFDPYVPGLDPEENERRRKGGMQAEYYVTGVNAVSEEGELFYLDGIGNRVGAVSYGPGAVVVVTSIKKIVPDEAAAWKRIKEEASPPNAKRFGANVPCVETGECSDCDSPNRICNIYLRIHRVGAKNRFHIIFVDENLGF